MSCLRRIAHLTIVLLACACSQSDGRIYPYDSASMSYPVGPDTAIASATAWLGEEVGLELRGVSVISGGGSPEHHYALRSADGRIIMKVDCTSGEVHRWDDVPGWNAYSARLASGSGQDERLPDSVLNAAVLQFLRAKYADFDALNMQSLNPGKPNAIYAQRLPNGVVHYGNHAACLIDEWTGQVVEYFGAHASPPTINVDPTISGTSAEQLAMDFVGLTEVHDPDAEDPETVVNPQSAFVLYVRAPWIETDDAGIQRLLWVVATVVHPSPGYTAAIYLQELTTPPQVASGIEMDVLVDAHTGEVLGCDPGGYLGAGPTKLDKAAAAKIKTHKPNPAALKNQPRLDKGSLEVDGVPRGDLLYPPLRVGDTGYLYAKYLPALYGGTITWSGGTARLTVGDRTITLKPEGKELLVGDQSIKLRQPPKVIAGRMYVPSEAIKRTCGATATWDAKEKTLRLTSGELPLKPQFRRPKLASTAAE